jgi:uncharacterized membrane protein YkvA (DUF1232 family)
MAEHDASWARRVMAQNRKRAEAYLRSPQKLRELNDQVQVKARMIEERGGPLGETVGSLSVFSRLLRAYAKGEYREVPWGVLMAAVTALMYFLMPWDAIPDFLVGVGLIDDAVFIAFAAGQIRNDIQKFHQWEFANRVGTGSDVAEIIPINSQASAIVEDVYLPEHMPLELADGEDLDTTTSGLAADQSADSPPSPPRSAWRGFFSN